MSACKYCYRGGHDEGPDATHDQREIPKCILERLKLELLCYEIQIEKGNVELAKVGASLLAKAARDVLEIAKIEATPK